MWKFAMIAADGARWLINAISQSTGIADAGKPIITNEDGKIDISLIPDNISSIAGINPVLIDFNSTSPIPLAFVLAADRVKVVVLETFNGTFSLEVGDSENHSRFVSISNNQLIAGNIFDFNCGHLYSTLTYVYVYITGTATAGKLYLYFQDVNSIVNSSEIPSGGLGGDWGINNYRYEYRSNAGGTSDADKRSGFYQSSGTLSNYPVNSGTWHFLNISSDNALNNLQICGLATDQLFYGRKTNGDSSQTWSQFVTTFDGETEITGRIGVNATSINAFLDIICSSNNVGLEVIGSASQSQDLAQFRNSANTLLASINSQGNFVAQNINSAGKVGINVSNPASSLDIANTSNIPALKITGNASQSGDLIQVFNSAGTALASLTFQGHLSAQNINATGRLGINLSTTAGAFADINCSSNVIGMRITGNASQTQDLVQFRNSVGTVLANISSAGNLSVQSIKTNLTGSATRIANVDLSGNIGAGGDIVDGFISNTTVINLLINNSNWSNKVYTGVAITGTFAGQVYVSADYYYFFKSDNTPVRMLLS